MVFFLVYVILDHIKIVKKYVIHLLLMLILDNGSITSVLMCTIDNNES
jgi:hypothetical protein